MCFHTPYNLVFVVIMIVIMVMTMVVLMFMFMFGRIGFYFKTFLCRSFAVVLAVVVSGVMITAFMVVLRAAVVAVCTVII